MATRIAFSTHYPDRMNELAGKPTRFPEKILKGIYDGTTYYIGECPNCGWIGSSYFALGGGQIADTGDYSDLGCPKCFTTLEDSDYDFGYYGQLSLHPKTTTIRSNYEYWKSKEGQLIQPFFWAGKPYRSKQVVFCPAVRLAKVRRIKISHNNQINRDSGLVLDKSHVWIDGGHSSCIWKNGEIANCAYTIKRLTQTEGFEHPDHFWLWFNEDFEGAYLELESVKQ